VYFEEGETADLFTMHLRTLLGKRPVEFLPDYREPATINKPLGVGRHDNGQEFKALFREVAVMIVGVRDSGKSNLMSVLIAQIARCPDALIFVIDLKGGRMARPWLVPWLLGRSPRPVIDWLATTREEAEIMLDALIAAGQARAEDGEGGEKITPSRVNPAVFLFVDETAIMTGHGIREGGISNSKIATKLAVIAETFRSEAIDPVVAALRSNVDIMGSTALKAQSTLRFGLRVNEPQDGQSVFPNDEAAAKALSKITEQGAGMARVGSRITPPIQFYRITLERCIHVAQLTGAWRPKPDQVLLDAFGEAYEGRWDRMEERLGKWRAKAERGDYGGEELEEGKPRAAVALLDRPPEDRDPALGGGGGPGGGEPPGWDPAADTDDEFWRVVGQEQDPEGKIHPARRAMREILIRAGDDGVKAGELYSLMKGQGHRVHRTTLYEWLAKEAELGRVSRYGRGKNDPNARWVWVRQVNGPARRDDQEDW
jgi:S-DNA-T family DNA segregation ATPase FtsK/SpoIIIE